MVCYDIEARVAYDLARMLNAELNNAEVKMLINGNNVRFNVFNGELAVEVNGKVYATSELGSVDFLPIESDTIGKNELSVVREFASDVCLATLVNVLALNGLIYHAENYDKLEIDGVSISQDECGVDIMASRFGYVDSKKNKTRFFIIGEYLGGYKGMAYYLANKLLNNRYGDDYFTPLNTEKNLVGIEKDLGHIKEYARDTYKSKIS